MRLLSIVLLFILWLLLGWLFMIPKCVECCGTNTTKSEETSEKPPMTKEPVKKMVEGPILFDYKGNTAHLGDGWANYKESLLGRLKGDDKMEITGYYTSGETPPTGFANMGLARADAARKALGLSEDRTSLRGVLSAKEVDQENRFRGVDFKTISSKPASIEEVDDKTIIRFPYNSTDKLSDSTVENYLDKVAKRVKASGERVRLTGHTDSDGDANYNLSLGKKRAEIIKRYLIGKGVAANKILTSSKGETAPIANNSTNAGKAQNRRTELQIIK